MSPINLTLPALPFSLSTSFIFNMPVLLIILVIFFVAYVVLTSVLWYHWSKYGMGGHGIHVGQTLFLFVSVALFVLALAGLYYF